MVVQSNHLKGFLATCARVIKSASGWLVLALVLAGCAVPVNGAPPAQSAAGTPTPAGTDVFLPEVTSPSTVSPAKVTLINMSFMPSTLTISAGTKVEWDNQDNVPHTVTADRGTFDSGNLNPGQSFQMTFAQPGTFAYYCSYHGAPGGVGMSGQIIVK